MNINFELIKKFIQPKKILDIGAHLGEFNDYCKFYFPNSYIFSVEANKECENILFQKNINYKICLLGNENKIVNFYKNKKDLLSTGNSIYKELTHHFSEENILIETHQMERLDDIFDDNISFDFIKIDTQGSEIDIIKGGEKLIKKCAAILLETSYEPYNEGAPLENEVIDYMKSIGFIQKEILDESPSSKQRDILFVR